MNGRSLLQYWLIVFMNSFLFMGVVFYPAVSAVLHLLIYYLSFNWLVDQKQFRSNWSTATFVLVPDLVQTIVCVVLFYRKYQPGDFTSDLRAGGFVPVFTALMSMVELAVLVIIYRGYKKRKIGLQRV